MRKVVAVGVPLLAATVLLTGCLASKETRDAADRLEDALGHPPGTVSVDVHTGVSGVADDYVETVAVLEDDATAAEIAALVAELPGLADDAGLPDADNLRRLRLERPDGVTTLDVAWAATVDRAAVEAAAARWLGVTELLDGTLGAELSTTGPLAWRIELGSRPVDAPAVAYRELRARPDLVDAHDSWDLGALSGDLRLSLGGHTLPSAAEVAVWSELVAGAQQLPADFRPTSVGIGLLAGRAVAGLTFLAPDGVTKENLTPAAYGDRLWPALHTQLRAVDSLRQPWTYVVEWAPSEIPEFTSIMLSLLDGEEPIDNGDYTTWWSQAARDYVDGL